MFQRFSAVWKRQVCEHSANITDENGALLGYDFKNTSFATREYIEDHDLEMDIWLELEPAQDNLIKEVKLVVVPFRKSVDAWDEEYYKDCPGTARWFGRQFFCSAVVKCAVFTQEEFSKLCVKKDPGGFMLLPAFIIGFAVLMACTFLLCFGIKIMLIHFNSNEHHINCISPGNGVPEGGGHILASLSTPERDQRRPTSPELPLDLRPMEFLTQPPSYDEVVGVGYKDDPPMYSVVAHTNTHHCLG